MLSRTALFHQNRCNHFHQIHVRPWIPRDCLEANAKARTMALLLARSFQRIGRENSYIRFSRSPVNFPASSILTNALATAFNA